MIEFNKDKNIKPKVYHLVWTIKDENKQLIIIITYGEYTFSLNDNIKKA